MEGYLRQRDRPLERRPRKTGRQRAVRHVLPTPAAQRLAVSVALAAIVSIALSGRHYRRALAAWGAGGALAAIAGIVAGSIEARRPRREQHSIPIVDLPQAFDGLCIAQVSDIHLSYRHVIPNLRHVRGWIAEARPDLIVLTGDFVDQIDDLPLLSREIEGLRAPLGVYAVLGNHDYWSDPARLEEILARAGIKLLVNEHRVLDRDGAQIVLAGVDDPWYGDADIEAALHGAPPGVPVILLAHVANYITTASRFNVALQLSGHAHAGHFDLPLLGPMLLPRMTDLYHRGLHLHGRTWLYVNRGLGGRPLRINAPPELALLVLRSVGPKE